MPTFRITYRPVPGVRWLVEDVEADRYAVVGCWHTWAAVVPVVGIPRWVCRLRVHERDVVEVRAPRCSVDRVS